MKSHQPTTIAVVLGAVMLTAVPAAAQAPAAIGRVKIVSGAAFIVRSGTSSAATPGAVLLETDSLRTGPDGRLGVSLNDDTRVSLGPDSEARLSRYRYAPSEGALSLVVNFMRGVAVYASGQIAKLSPDAVRLETPAAIVGVRGTTVGLRVAAE